MNIRKLIGHAAGVAVLIGFASTAAAVPVKFEIESYREGNFSASWLHGSTGCSNSVGPNTGMTLYMCGGPLKSISGHILGDYDASFGILQISGGTLNIGGTAHAVGSGLLGPFGGFPPVWGFSIANHGFFGFESIAMGAGKPNFFDGEELILWGQNLAAYACAPGQPNCAYGDRWGIDLYGKRVPVPEPGTLALFGLGLIGIAAARRRRVAS